MKPLALAMTLLQGEKTTYLGHLVPTIMGIKCELNQSTDRVVEPLVETLSSGRSIDRRFEAVLTDKEHLIASALLAQFKLNFLPEDARLWVKRQVLNYVQEVAVENYTEAHLPTANVAQDDDNLFSFMTSAGSAAARSTVARQVEEFMDSCQPTYCL